MSRKTATARNVVKVLRRLATFVEKEPADAKALYARDLNRWLDELVGQDAFGTEAQCDPRGDQRD